MMAPREDDDDHHLLRALAARAVTDSLRAAASRSSSSAADRAARFRDCVRSLEAEKAKMEVFRRELPISVHLVADVIEWLKEELAQQHRRQQPPPPPEAADLFAPAAEAAPPAPPQSPPAPVNDGAVKAEADADADDKRSWMSSAQLWSCGTHHDSTANTNGVAAAAAHSNKMSSAFVPTTLASLPTPARSPPDDAAGKPAAMPVPDLSLLSPAAGGGACAATAAPRHRQHQHQQQHQQAQQQRKARRCWSPELHRRFVAALQRLGGAQVATPKQIREMMKVDGLTNDEVKSHLQKYRLHTRRASSDGGGGDQQHGAAAAAVGGLWPSALPEQQYATSQHSTSQSQSGSPQGPLQLTVSSRATAGDSCDGDEAEGGGRWSESYGWEMQQHGHGTKASSS